jgi:hypothetical protein
MMSAFGKRPTLREQQGRAKRTKVEAARKFAARPAPSAPSPWPSSRLMAAGSRRCPGGQHGASTVAPYRGGRAPVLAAAPGWQPIAGGCRIPLALNRSVLCRSGVAPHGTRLNWQSMRRQDKNRLTRRSDTLDFSPNAISAQRHPHPGSHAEDAHRGGLRRSGDCGAPSPLDGAMTGRQPCCKVGK